MFEVHAGSFIGVAASTPLGVNKQIRAIDAGEVFNIGGDCDSVSATAAQNVILS